MENSEPRVVKKYANRKLYDTEARHYITLQGLSRLVDEGYSITVVDQVTGANITEQVLAGRAHEGHAAAHTPRGSRARRRIPTPPMASRLAVRDQLSSLLRGSLTLPLVVGRNAVSRLERQAPIEDYVGLQEFAELSSRVDTLADMVDLLRAELIQSRTKTAGASRR